MSRTGAQWDDWQQGKKHKEKVTKKIERLRALKALHDTRETHPDCDHEYLLELRAKIRNTQNQLSAMAV